MRKIVIVETSTNRYVCYHSASGFTKSYDEATRFTSLAEFLEEVSTLTRPSEVYKDSSFSYAKLSENEFFRGSKKAA